MPLCVFPTCFWWGGGFTLVSYTVFVSLKTENNNRTLKSFLKECFHNTQYFFKVSASFQGLLTDLWAPLLSSSCSRAQSGQVWKHLSLTDCQSFPLSFPVPAVAFCKGGVCLISNPCTGATTRYQNPKESHHSVINGNSLLVSQLGDRVIYWNVPGISKTISIRVFFNFHVLLSKRESHLASILLSVCLYKTVEIADWLLKRILYVSWESCSVWC